MNLIKHITATAGLIASITFFVGLSGCKESEEDDLILNSGFESIWKGEHRLVADVTGETIEVEVNISTPFVYGTIHELPEYQRLLEDDNYQKFHRIIYDYDPLTFEYHSDDIVNLITPDYFGSGYIPYYDERFVIPCESMLEAELTILNDENEFDYQWSHVLISNDKVTVTVEPNITDENRTIYLLFLRKEYGYVNNIIEIMQPGKAAG